MRLAASWIKSAKAEKAKAESLRSELAPSVTQKRPLVSHFPRARWVAATQKNAPVNSPAPANGIVGASAPLRLFRGAYRRSDGKLDVIVRDPEHYLLGCFVVHLLGQNARFLGSPTPVFWIFEMRDIGHRGGPFLGPYTLARETACGFYSRERR